MAPDSVKPKLTLTEILYGLFLKLVGACCLWAGLNYWGMLVGFSLSGQGRFDLLPLAWKAAATTLAVIFPVAAVGLWLTVSWGPVVWVLAAGVEIAMYEWYPAIFGARPVIVLLHVSVACTFLLFRAVLFYQRYRRASAVTVDLP
ncbi:DUF6163 family protein [Pararhizobium sp.]|uniref:DUF6163 family protein n=1 Tax=Pararhizobium sp. TaxID=1977563 RepID=UPI002721590C|nr:DUF6163 family protein [Pararhizobium sp.]MDO9416016.1 DUF6163 family protein [Pararhizobium sp.]